MSDTTETIASLREAVQAFIDERGLPEFHTPGILGMSLVFETAGLLQRMQSLDLAESAAREQVGEAIANVCCSLLTLVNALELDLSDIVKSKLVKETTRKPVDPSRRLNEPPRRRDDLV